MTPNRRQPHRVPTTYLSFHRHCNTLQRRLQDSFFGFVARPLGSAARTKIATKSQARTTTVLETVGARHHRGIRLTAGTARTLRGRFFSHTFPRLLENVSVNYLTSDSPARKPQTPLRSDHSMQARRTWSPGPRMSKERPQRGIGHRKCRRSATQPRLKATRIPSGARVWPTPLHGASLTAGALERLHTTRSRK